MKRILILLLALCSLKTMAQYPVTSISITLPQQPRPNTGDWAMPFVITAQAKLVNGQVPGYLTESRILVTIKKGGTKFCGSYTPTTAPASMFNSPVKTWSGGSAIGLIGSNCVLPPGSYDLCVQFFSNNPAVSVAMPYSSEVCKTFTITEPKKITYSPPQNVMPVDEKVFTQKEANLPIIFRWTQVLPRPKEDVIYKVRVLEIRKGQSKTEALKTNAPVEVLEVKNMTQATSKLAQRCNGCEYVWNVEASKKSQLGDIEMLGTSEGSSFRINASPNNTLAVCDDVSVSNTNIDCQAFPTYLIHDKITNNSGKNIISWTLTSTAGAFNNTGPQSISGNSSVSTHAIGLTGAMPDANRYVFGTYTFTFDDNSTCTIGTDYLLPNCKPTCACGQWSNIRFRVPSTTGGATTYVTGSCGGNDTVKISPNANFTIEPAYTCTGNNCVVSYKYDVFFQNGVKLYDNVDAGVIVASEMNTCGEVYKMVIKPTCNGQSCSPCTIYLKRNCPPSCQCNGWSALTYQIGLNPSRTAGCNDTIAMMPSERMSITPQLNCGPACSAQITADIYAPDGNLRMTDIPVPITNFIPNAPGNCGKWKIVFKGKCGANIQCSNCTLYIRVDCPPTCQCTNHPTIVKRTVINGTVQEIPFSCTEPAPYINKLKCNGNDTIIVKNFCTGNCPAQSASLTIKRPDGTTFNQPIWSTAPGEVWFLLPPSNQNGIYGFTFSTNCGNQTCTNCKIDFQQNCTPSCSCGAWSNVVFRAEIIPGIPTNIGKQCLDTFALPKDVNFTITPIYTCTGNNCNASYLYDVFLSGGTQIYSNVTAAQINPAQLNSCGEVYRIIIKPTCGLQSCTPCTLYLKRNCVQCTCGTWTDTKATYTVQSTVQKDNPVSCGKGITVDCNKPVTISWNFNCIGQCASATTVAVYPPSGGRPMGMAGGSSITFTPTILTGGPYKVVLKGTCDNNTCDSCIIYVTPKCIPDCDCGKWNGVKLNGKRYECNAKTIPWKCNAEVEFAADYQCAPNNETCKTNISWDIKLEGKIIKRGTGSITGAGLFKPTTNGNYVITFYPVCNDKKCPPCTVTLSVTDCMECSCEKFTFTGTVTSTGKNKEGKCTYAFDGFAYNPCEERKMLSLSASAGISFTPASITLGQGNTPVHFVVNNLTGVSAGYINAVILINGIKCERKINISLPPCDNCKCPENKNIEIIATNVSGERFANKVLENLSKPAKAKLNALGDMEFLGNVPGQSKARKSNNTAAPVVRPGENKWTCNNGKRIHVACKSTWDLKDLFTCPDKECNKQVTYSLRMDNEVIQTGSLPDKITFGEAGNYSLFVNGKCGSNNCAQCEIKITVDPCDDCGKCEVFNYAYPLLNNQGEFMSPKTGGGIECGETYYAFCKQPVVFIEYMECGTPENPKPGKSKIIIRKSGTNQVLTPDQYTLKPDGHLEAIYGFSVGLYEVTIYYYPPNSTDETPPCKTCTYFIKAMCECKCENNKITEMVYTPKGENEIPFNCNDNITLKCDKEYTFYAGNPNADCKLLKGYRIQGNGLDYGGFGNIKDLKLPAGNYQVSFYTLAGSLDNGEICDSCKINITVTCNDCECGTWKSITTKYIYKNAEKQRDLKCGDSLDVDCNKPFKLNADYNCIGAKCDKVMLYYVIGPDGAELVSGEALPVNFTPTKDGIYKIILRANCGSGACPDCIIYLKVVCDPPPCDFCRDFTESSLTQKSYAYSADNNQLDLTQSLNIPSQYKIKQVKVELVAFDWQTDNKDCRKCQKNSMAFGVLTETMLKANGIEYEGVTPMAIFNTHEQDINCLPANGTQLSNGSNIKLGISLPWQTSLSCCGDKFSFCVRYTIVTADCKTCSIVKCYTDVPPRQHKIINDGDGTGN